MPKSLTIKPEDIEAINRFVEKYKKDDTIDLISTIIENKNCGLFLKDSNGKITEDLVCLAVAATKDNNWHAIDLKHQELHFDSSQVR